MANRSVKLISLTTVPYAQALALQLQLRKNLYEALDPDDPMGYLVCLEHPSTVTLGKRGQVTDVVGRHLLAAQGIPLFKIDRGGEATAHEPGQLVIYPILKLDRVGMGVVDLIRGMAQCLSDALSPFGLDTMYNTDAPGLWTCDPDIGEPMIKIASVGMRVSKGVTTHGAAINLTNDHMHAFKLIVPCGMPDAPMSSVRALLEPEHRQDLSRSTVQSNFLDAFAAFLDTTFSPFSPILPIKELWPLPLEIEPLNH